MTASPNTTTLNIVADENMAALRETFSPLGEIHTLPGRGIGPDDVASADILLVRSVTQVNESLLAGSPVQFVGSATIGFDHLDIAWLEHRGIRWATAPGSNATSAAEWVIGSLVMLDRVRGTHLPEGGLSGLTMAIVGCGNVGSRVQTKAQALGLKTLICDPPRAAAESRDDFVTLDLALQADIITFHTPLTRSGEHPTFHLLNPDNQPLLKENAIVINAARGSVIDERVVLQREDITWLFDVFENEPAINPAVVQRCTIATPHIAGYSQLGKLRGTQMIYRRACEHFGRTAHTPASPEQHALGYGREVAANGSAGEVLYQLTRHAFSVEHTDQRLRQTLSLPADEAAKAFDTLRKSHPQHLEYSQLELRGFDPLLEKQLFELGFSVTQAADIP